MQCLPGWRVLLPGGWPLVLAGTPLACASCTVKATPGSSLSFCQYVVGVNTQRIKTLTYGGMPMGDMAVTSGATRYGGTCIPSGRDYRTPIRIIAESDPVRMTRSASRVRRLQYRLRLPPPFPSPRSHRPARRRPLRRLPVRRRPSCSLRPARRRRLPALRRPRRRRRRLRRPPRRQLRR